MGEAPAGELTDRVIPPRRQLAIAVALTSLLIAVAWVVLYRTHRLVAPLPPLAAGPSFAEVAREFDDVLRRFPPPVFKPVTPRASAPAMIGSDDPVPPSAVPTPVPQHLRAPLPSR